MELTRRDLIQTAGAAAVLAASPAIARAASLAHPAIIVHDSALALARRFAAAARGFGLDPRDTQGEITAIAAACQRQLRAQAPVIAGITPYAQMFALRLLVERPGFRLRLLQPHAGACAVEGDAALCGALAETADPATGFARLLASPPPQASGAVPLVTTTAIAPVTPVSWLISPAPPASIPS